MLDVKGPLVYVATDTTNGMKYIGITIRSIRLRNHKRDPSHFGNIMRKRPDTITWEIIQCSSVSEMEEIEELMVNQETLDSGLLYNKTLGGNHCKHSTQTKAKISKVRKGMKFSDKHKASMSKSRTGVGWSASQRLGFLAAYDLPYFIHTTHGLHKPESYKQMSTDYSIPFAKFSEVGKGKRKSTYGWRLATYEEISLDKEEYILSAY